MAGILYNLFRLLIGLGALALAYSILSDGVDIVVSIPTPLDSYVPTSGQNVTNVAMTMFKSILLVLAVLALIITSIIEAQRQNQ